MQSRFPKGVAGPSRRRRFSATLTALVVCANARTVRADWAENWGEMNWGFGATPVPTIGDWGLLGLAAAMGTVALIAIAKRRGTRMALTVFVGLAVPLAGYATTISLPYFFVNGTPAEATEVNANFDVLVAESNSQDLRIFAVESGIPHTHPGTDITSQVGDADTVDGSHASELEESGEILANIAAHASISPAHHPRFTPTEVFALMGPTANPNPLNHGRYTDAEAVSAASGGDAGTLDTLDSTDFSLALHGHGYGGVAIVAKSGGDYLTAQLAMSDVATWCGIASSSNRCLVHIMPGVYSSGTPVFMDPFVDIQGSGENSTVLHFTGFSGPAVGVVSDSELRLLTVDKISSPLGSVAIGVSSMRSRITHVTVFLSGGGSGIAAGGDETEVTNVTVNVFGGTGMNVGVDVNNSNGPIRLTDVTGTVTGGAQNYAVRVVSGKTHPILSNVSINRIVVNGNQIFVPHPRSELGLFTSGELLQSLSELLDGLGTPSSTNRYLVKLDAGVFALANSTFTMRPYVDIEGSGENTTVITSTQSSGSLNETSATLVGANLAQLRSLTVENQGGGTHAIAIYNSAASPKITNVTALASGASSNNRGVFNTSSSAPIMTDVIARGTGGGIAFGVHNNASSPIMTNVSATGVAGTSNRGVRNIFAASPIMTNVTATASGGTGDYGIYSSSSSPSMRNCSIVGTTNSILNTGSSTANVAASMLNGAVSGTGFACVGAYDSSFAALSTSCL